MDAWLVGDDGKKQRPRPAQATHLSMPTQLFGSDNASL